jgi:hypothetical protein
MTPTQTAEVKERAMSKRKSSATAREIADYLFTNGAGSEATRLVLVQDNQAGGYKDLGGWCKEAVVHYIERVLNSRSK